VVVPGSDAIVVRYLSPAAAKLTTASTSNTLTVDNSTNLVVNDIGAVTDCVKASLFQVTAMTGAGATRTLAHIGGGTAPGNALAAWLLPQQQYSVGAEVSTLQTVFLYVGQNPRGEPALYRRRLVGGILSGAEELVEGVESLQLTYGEDTNGDLAADQYSEADSVADWSAVVSVRAAFLVRTPANVSSDTDAGIYGLLGAQINPLNDARLRRIFTTTISLRNRLL
jgi:type IV pilus assembly protein PilW